MVVNAAQDHAQSIAAEDHDQVAADLGPAANAARSWAGRPHRATPFGIAVMALPVLGTLNSEGDIHVRPSGTSAAAAMRRRRKDRPDLHARILAHLGQDPGCAARSRNRRDPPTFP
jgi:hypothetical protein